MSKIKIYLSIISFFSLGCGLILNAAPIKNLEKLDEIESSNRRTPQRITFFGSMLNFLGRSDVYPTASLPQPYESENKRIKYSTPAIQGMERNNIDSSTVEEMINKAAISQTFEGIRDIYQNNIHIIFKHSRISDQLEVSSVWKE